MSGSAGWGIALRLASTLLFTLMALCVVLAAAEAPVGQIVFHRSLWALVPIILYLILRGQLRHGLRTRQKLSHLRRSLYGCASMFLSFIALAQLSLALATALAFLAPLLAVPVAMITLREKPGWLVGGATLVGFLGVLIMVAPALTGPALAAGTVLGFGAGLLNAAVIVGAKIEVKRLTATELPGTITFYFAIICALGGLASWPFGWAEVSDSGFLWLVGAGLTGGLAQICMTEAVARAPISLLAPFEYVALLWALLLDLLVFGKLPGLAGLVGCGVIVAAAALVAFADRLAPRRPR